jgi:integrase
MAKDHKIGLQKVRALPPGTIIWDSGPGSVTGFGARRQRGPAVVYFVKYRPKGSSKARWYKIGRHGAPWTPETARDEAMRILGQVAGGGDPAADRKAARRAVSVTELCDLYLAEAEGARVLTRSKRPKKASTLAADRGRIAAHIKPLLGDQPAAAVTRDDVERFMFDIAEGKSAKRAKGNKLRGHVHVTGGRMAATRTVGLLGAIYNWGERRGFVPGPNPVRGVERFADRKRERRLSEEEYAAAGAALRQAEANGIWPPATAAARFLMLTGWRTSEALTLQWRELDLPRRTARLVDTKTGASVRPLSHAACDVLKALPRTEGGRVFPATRGKGPLAFKGFWRRIAKLGDLQADITPHTLRHSFASLAADLEYSEATIGGLVGHVGRTVTSRYLHSADAVLLAAADAVANRTAELMSEAMREAAVVPLRGAR